MMKWDKIAIMVPTYGRSKTLLPVFIKSCLETVSDKSKIHFFFCVNESDKETLDYLNQNADISGMVTIVTESLLTPNLAIYFNMLCDAAKKHGEGIVITMLGDDMEFKTKDWDVSILSLINHYNGIGVFWANDGYIAKERCAVNLFVTQKMIEATEHPFMCEEFAGDMIDYLWTKVGRYTRSSHYFPNVLIFHNHNTHKKPDQWDATFKRLVPAQQQGHRVGKERAKEISGKIAAILEKKGFTGDSIC